jgi:hypothetical protein
MRPAIREIHDHDPFVHAESVATTSPIAADLTVVCFRPRALATGGDKRLANAARVTFVF